MLVSCLAKLKSIKITPHAGGSGLDELSPHIQLFNLARVDIDLNSEDSLTVNVGFCSNFFLNPTDVKKGYASVSDVPGYLVGLSDYSSKQLIKFDKGVSWLKL